MAKTLSTRRRLLAVLAGGFLGTITRYLLSMLIQGMLGKSWPYDIFFINVTGALIIAFITTLADATFLIGPTRRLFINVGFLGAYTTFSSMALGDVLLIAKGALLPALLYIVLSLVIGVLAVFLGDWLGQQCIRYGRRRGTVAKRSGKLPQQKSAEHLDIDDDLLIPDVSSVSQDRRE